MKEVNRTPLDEFKWRMASVTPATILLTGAKIWRGSVNPDHSKHVQHAKWVGTDIEAGEGVEVVCDLHRLDLDTDQKYEGIFSPATLEHVDRPWVAMKAMANCLKPNGVLFLHTHQTFPLHGYPNDHFRFSTSALRTLCFDANLEVIECAYDAPCTITPPPSVHVWNTVAESYLNVSVCAVKK